MKVIFINCYLFTKESYLVAYDKALLIIFLAYLLVFLILLLLIIKTSYDSCDKY